MQRQPAGKGRRCCGRKQQPVGAKIIEADLTLAQAQKQAGEIVCLQQLAREQMMALHVFAIAEASPAVDRMERQPFPEQNFLIFPCRTDRDG